MNHVFYAGFLHRKIFDAKTQSVCFFFVCLFLLPKTIITTTHLFSLINNFHNANFIKTNLKITVKTCLETLVKITPLWFLFLPVDIAEIIHDMKITICTQLNGRKRVREKPDGWAFWDWKTYCVFGHPPVRDVTTGVLAFDSWWKQLLDVPDAV